MSAGADPRESSDEELRAAYEAELSRITSTDMIAQAAVSLLTIGRVRLGAGARQGAEAQGAPPRDLEQVRDAIDGARALLEILERRLPGEVRPLREHLSQLQMAFARAVQEGAPPPAGEPGAQAGGEGAAGGGSQGGAPREGSPGDGSPGGTDGGGSKGGGTPGGGSAGGAAGQPGQGEGGARPPGPAESSGRLWVPGS